MNICHVCGIPLDANYFDHATIQNAPNDVGVVVKLAEYTLPPQYCGVLLCFAQYAEPKAFEESEECEKPENGENSEANHKTKAFYPKDIYQTPGYEWAVLCNNQPRDPYLPTDLILNPWGQNNFPIQLRLEEGCVVQLVVRKVSASPFPELEKVGGRLQGRYWYNTNYGGLPNRL